MFKLIARSNLRSAAQVILLAAASLLASAAHANDLFYWYYDEAGNFNPGDLSLSGPPLKRPAWACAMRADSGKTMQWVGENGNTIGSIDIAPQFNAQSRGDVGGCRPKPAIEKMDNSKLWPKDENNVPIEVGFHQVRYEAMGNRWVDKNGDWPACNNCVLPLGFKILVADSRWQLLDLSFKTQREGARQRPCVEYGRAESASAALATQRDRRSEPAAPGAVWRPRRNGSTTGRHCHLGNGQSHPAGRRLPQQAGRPCHGRGLPRLQHGARQRVAGQNRAAHGEGRGQPLMGFNAAPLLQHLALPLSRPPG